MNDQLVEIRKIHHDNYIKKHNNIPIQINKWLTGTILIASDSICNKLDEKRLCRNNRVKVRSFPGATINDMYYNLKPLLEKQPDYVILHVSTNDAISKTSDVILIDLLSLKIYIESTLPSCVVIISEPTIRYDNAKARQTITPLFSQVN